MKTKLYDAIKDILIKYPNCRNDDKKLIWTYWETLAGHTLETIPYHFFLSMSCTPESITRARRSVQTDNKDLRADDVIKSLRNEREETKGTFIYSLKN